MADQRPERVDLAARRRSAAMPSVGQDTADEVAPDTPPAASQNTAAAANQRSRRAFWNKIMLAGAVLAIIATAIGGWFWTNRDQSATVVTVGAGPRGTDAYQLMSDISEVVERHSEAVRLRVLATGGSSQNVKLLNDGVIDLATIGASTPVVSHVRLVSHLFSDHFIVIARSESSIRRFPDLRGKRIALPPDGTDGLMSFWAVADHYDLPSQTMDFLSMRFKDAHTALLQGDVDAIFRLSSLRDQELLRLFEDAELTGKSLDVVAIDQSEAIALKRPALVSETIPRGAFTGAFPAPRADTTTPTIRRNLVSREDVDVDAIAELTRILFEHRLDLVTRDALAGNIEQPDAIVGLTVPLHEGAEQFFNRDEPTYIQENAEPLALGVTLTALIISTLVALRSRLAAGQKNRADNYNYQLLAIAEQGRVADSAEQIAQLQSELNEVLQTMVVALDTDEVTDEGFQSFSLLWESVRRQLSEHRQDLAI
ncbi:MAG: TAXI family TRAP transporter solute-binding subunit [Pseudomonadota bacterium]